MRHHRARRDHGFTLVELLVVVVIIGILAGVAIPVFLNQKAKGYESQVKAQVNTVAKMVESLSAESPSGTLVPSSDGKAVTDTDGTATVNVAVTSKVGWNVTGDTRAYCVVAWSVAGGKYTGDAPLVYNSTKGGIQPSGGDCAGVAAAPAGFTSGAAMIGAGGDTTAGTPPPPDINTGGWAGTSTIPLQWSNGSSRTDVTATYYIDSVPAYNGVGGTVVAHLTISAPCPYAIGSCVLWNPYGYNSPMLGIGTNVGWSQAGFTMDASDTTRWTFSTDVPSGQTFKYLNPWIGGSMTATAWYPLTHPNRPDGR